MKRSTLLLKAFWGTAMVLAFSLTTSCKNDTKKEDPKEVANDTNDQKFDDNDKKADDSETLVKAAAGNLAEIEIGKLAQTKGTTAHVREFGKMLVDDHSKALAELSDFAAKKNVTLPTAITEDGKDKYNKLNEKNGKDFDKAFSDAMVDDHEKDIKMYEDASQNANDPDVRTWAAAVVPTLQQHLEHAKMLQDENK
jgi:putative membrane protein